MATEEKKQPVQSREAPIPESTPLWKSLGLLEERGRPVINAENMLRALENDAHLDGVIWFDEFQERVFTAISADAHLNGKANELTDIEFSHLLTYMQGHLGIVKCSEPALRMAVRSHAHRNAKNELKDWLEKLVHDGTPRLETFFSNALGAKKSMYTRAVSKNFWLSMIARVYRPGCQVDNMVVLEGAQGIGKNRVLRAIGGKWYAQAPGTPEEKDFYLAFQGKLILEFAELANLRKADAEKIKSCITCTTDRYRIPYDSTSRDHPRQCVFVGTTNENEWHHDPSGARRFWPIRCEEEGMIDVKYAEDNREQLFAEAVKRFKEGESWWEVPESAREEQEARRVRDPWEEMIKEWLNGHPTDEVTVLQVAVDVLGLNVDRVGMLESKRIAGCLRASGRQIRHTKSGNLWGPMRFPPPADRR